MSDSNPKLTTPDRGFLAVLRNRYFLYLWIAQVTSMTVQNGIHFTQMILIEEITHSTAHMGAVILSFSLPAVLLSAVAGLFVDRFPKKQMLVVTNFLRVLTALAYILFLRTTSGTTLLLAIYALTFVNSAIGQFFSPAEAATIPLLVGQERLMPANSLFNLTLTGSQVLGLVILAPLTVKLWGIEGSFFLMGVIYLIATWLTALLPQDVVPHREQDGASVFRRAWNELAEGYRFVVARKTVYLSVTHLTLMATMFLVMAMMAPGFAARVLGMQTEDAIYIFAPAGVGMLLASYLIGRYGYRVRRELLINGGLMGMGLTLAALAWVGRGHEMVRLPIFKAWPEITLSVAGAVMTCALLLGMEVALVSVPAQTTLQEESLPEVRGRVFAVLFTISNLVAIPPMLTIGNLADRMGIPRVTLLIAVIVLGIAGWSIWYGQRTGAWRAVRPGQVALAVNPERSSERESQSARERPPTASQPQSANRRPP